MLSVCGDSQTPSASKRSKARPMNSMQNLSTLQKMIDMEEVNRSETNDHRALNDLDSSFHKQAWRERVAQWCYDVLDYLEESRDVAAVAMNTVDRYVAILKKECSSSTSFVIGEFDYEVISFTALFLAIRVSGSNKELEISELLKLSSRSGGPEVRHIVSAGNSMLEKLSWSHQLLTPNLFLRELVALLVIQHQKEDPSNAISDESVSKLANFALYLVEVSVCDMYFSTLAPSKIALGALALAIMRNSDFFLTDCRHKEFISRFFRIVNEQTSMNIECPQMNSIISRLLHVYNQSKEAAAQNIESETLLWEGSADSGGYQMNSPHIIVDEGEESNVPSERIYLSNESDILDALNESGLRAYPIKNQTRPVSPLPHAFR